ncbi:ring fyve phd zinc finger-containing protein, partial [Nannochloropsis gaditana]
ITGGGREGGKEGGRLEAGFCYGQSRGAFVGVSVEGTLLFSRDRVNEKFYGKRSVTVRELLNGDMAPPTAAEPLYEALQEVMGMEGEGKGGEEPDLLDGGKVRERREEEGEEEGEDEEEEEEGERRWRNMEKNAEMKTFRVSHELRQTDEDKARDHRAAEPKTEGAGGARREEEEEEVVLM